MRIPIQNSTSKEILLGLEPEGDTVPVAPGVTVTIVAGDDVDLSTLELDIDDGLFSVCLMGEKQVWSGDTRLR